MLPLLVLILAQNQSSAPSPQPPFRAEVNLVGGIEGTCVTPSGEIWFVTSLGHAYRSRDRGELWSEVQLPAAKPDEMKWNTDRLQQVGFFDAQHGMISGYIGENHDRVLVTEDGGTNWEPVRLPQEIWVYDAWYGPGANCWLVGSSGAVLHSGDRGNTWTVWGQPFDGDSRSGAVCGRDDRTVVVASLGGAIVVTQDAGANWTAVHAPGGKVKHLFLDGKRLVCATQTGFQSCDDFTTGNWRSLEFASEACTRVARHPSGMLFQLSSLEVVLANPQMELLRRWSGRLEETAVSLACNKDLAVALLDTEGRYEVIDDKGIRSMRMLSASSTPEWPMVDFDRAATGPMFGISKWGLYESADEGKTWERVHSLQDPETIRALEDGSGAFVRSDGKSWLWSSKEKSITPIPALDAFNEWLEIIRRGPMWLAIGSRHDDDEATLRRLRTSDTVMYGPGFESLVYGSADGGRTWNEVLRLPRHTIAACYVGDDSVLSLLLTGAEVARVHVTIQSTAGATASSVRLSGTVESQRIRPMPQWGCWIEFVGGDNGELGGNNFFHGSVVQRTQDGGKNWTPVPQADDGMHEELQFMRLGKGDWLRLSIPYKQPSRVDLWRPGEYSQSRMFAAGIDGAHVDAAGRLLLRCADGSVWSLAADASEWKQLHDIPIPGR